MKAAAKTIESAPVAVPAPAPVAPAVPAASVTKPTPSAEQIEAHRNTQAVALESQRLALRLAESGHVKASGLVLKAAGLLSKCKVGQFS